MAEPVTRVLDRPGVDALLAMLAGMGYATIGPVLRDGAVCLGPVAATSDLPVGWGDEQDGGVYRLRRRDDDALFGYNLGPDSWKRYLMPPSVRLWSAERQGEGFAVVEDEPERPRYAFVGVRACEVRAIRVLDRVMRGGDHADRDYAARREGVFVVAVNCGQAARTCFCASMGTGPRATEGFDVALTEVIDSGGHRFVAEAGTGAGAEVVARLPGPAAGEADTAAAGRAVENALATMGRRMETAGLREILQANPDHPRWDDVAARCLACGNCTMVCPTCFCTTVTDHTDLTGARAERHRHWDSCFTLDHSHVLGGNVRASTRSRYRQWMTHKLSTWHDQFGSSGCVGCGRCIAWCPVGIDITREARAIRGAGPAGGEGAS